MKSLVNAVLVAVFCIVFSVTSVYAGIFIKGMYSFSVKPCPDPKDTVQQTVDWLSGN